MKMSILNISIVVFVLTSAVSIAIVSWMAFANPQDVMNLVQVQLNNTDAFSSIRGVYGGAGATIVCMLLVLLRRNKALALVFLGLLWGFYAISRIITIYAEGDLGSFGSQWLKIEAGFAIIAVVLLALRFRFSESQVRATRSAAHGVHQ